MSLKKQLLRLNWLNPHQNLQTRLGISTATTAILLSTLLSLIVGQISRSQLETQIQDSLEKLADRAADRLDQGMFERYRDINSLAILGPIRQADSNAKKRVFLEEEQRTYPAYAWIGLTDTKGNIIAATQGLLEGKNVAQRPWYQNSISTSFVGDVHEAVLLAKLLPNPTGEPLRFVDIAAPIKDERGNFLGVICAHLSWSWAKEIQQSIEASLRNDRVEVLILNREGTVILGPQKSQGKEIKFLNSKFANSQQTGFSIETWFDRKSYATSFARTQGYQNYPGLGWIVLVRQPEATAFAPARSLQIHVFLCGIGIGLLFALWNWFRSRHIVEPLLQLTAAAQQITDGKQTKIPAFDRQDELASLSKVFQQMVLSLQYRTEELQVVNAELKQDIAKREAAEQTVSEQAALLDIATDAIFVRSLNNTILFWNRGAEKIYGWTAAEVWEKDAKSLLNVENSPQLEEAWQTTLAVGEWRGELKKTAKSQHMLTVESHWFLARDRDGQPKFILTVDTDISDKKQLESQFLRAQRLESLGTLAGGIAHDMNNVLTPIKAAAQLLLLKAPQLDDRNQRFLQILVDSSQRGADLVKQILSFARGVEGERTLVQSRHILQEIGEIARSTFPKSIAVEMNVPTKNLWTICADATQLHQVMMNLCVNARDAMPDGGVLTIVAENFSIDSHNIKLYPDALVGEYLSIAVSDTGEGMSPETLDRIFEPFYTTKEIGKGTGLGLSTVLGIIKSHGGFIQVFSEVGQGTRFCIYLPADFQTEEGVIEDDLVAEGNGELILVADDELLIVEVTKTLLEAHNYQVITANNGIEALCHYQECRDLVQVVLIDLMMPELDGFKAISVLKKLNPQLKIIASSGSYQSKSLPVGADAFLSKPYPLKKLLSTLQFVLNLKNN
ncbi:MAG: hybrid sensor histidine kinase/response regulator [Microcoleus sp.]